MGVKPQSFKSCNSGASDAPPKRRRVDKNSEQKPEPPAAPAVYVPKSAESENEEDDECYECGQGGNLTCCDVCPRVYHLRCLPSADSSALRRYEKQGVDADWWCPHCRRLLRASFALVRMISPDEPGSAAAAAEPPATPPAPRATTRSPDVSREMALSLFDFLADGQHEGAWAPLREAGAALAALLPSESAPWISLVDDDEGDGAAASPDGGDAAAAAAAAASAAPAAEEWVRTVEAELRGGRCAREWWAACCDDPAGPLPPAGAVAAAGANGGGGGSHKRKGELVAGETGGKVRTSGYRGVSMRYGAWKARIKQSGTDTVIGSYATELEAARAYDVKAKEIHGDAAVLNFPEE